MELEITTKVLIVLKITTFLLQVSSNMYWTMLWRVWRLQKYHFHLDVNLFMTIPFCFIWFQPKKFKFSTSWSSFTSTSSRCGRCTSNFLRRISTIPNHCHYYQVYSSYCRGIYFVLMTSKTGEIFNTSYLWHIIKDHTILKKNLHLLFHFLLSNT